MSKEIIINSDQKQTRIAIVEDGRLAELFIETKEVERTIGNLFVGRVRRIMPSIQAAFVDIGQKQDAFLHFSDLVDNLPDWLRFIQQKNPQVRSFKAEFARQPIKGRRSSSKDSGSSTSADGDNSDYDVETIEPNDTSAGSTSSERRPSKSDGAHGQEGVNPVNFLKRDAPILVRISKEPIQSKGSRVTTDISLAGRFLVLVPLAGYVAVSKKIVSYKERRRLKVLAKSLVPEGFGVIVRTVAEGHNAKSLDTDLRLLIQKWEKVEESLAEQPEIPCEIHEDVNMASSIIRDFFSEDFDRIVIDNDRLYRNIKGYVQAVAPKMASRVQVHNGNQPLFRAAKIEKAVEQAFSSRVDMPSGGYLFIEQTEAMHVVDVNSGRAGRGLSQEENSLRVNLEAATLIAEQVRLRDLGGILVVDFIDMRQLKNRRKVYDHLRREFRKDRAVTKVLQMSDFGLIQITRQRLRPSITTSFSIAETTRGSGDVEGSAKTLILERPSYETVEPEDLVRKIEDWIAGFKEANKKGPLNLIVHPFTTAYLNRSFPGRAFRWFLKYRIRVHIESDEHVDPLSFRFIDMNTGTGVSTRPEGVVAAEEPSVEDVEVPEESVAPQGRKSDSTRQRNGRDSRSRERGEDRQTEDVDGDKKDVRTRPSRAKSSGPKRVSGRSSGARSEDGDSENRNGSRERSRSRSRGRSSGKGRDQESRIEESGTDNPEITDAADAMEKKSSSRPSARRKSTRSAPRRKQVEESSELKSEAASEKPVSEKPAPEKVASEKPVSEKPAPEKVASEKPVSEKPAPEKVASEKPVSEKAAPTAAQSESTPKVVAPPAKEVVSAAEKAEATSESPGRKGHVYNVDLRTKKTNP